MKVTVVADEFVELEDTLKVVDTLFKTTGGAGLTNGSLIKKHPIKSPTESVVKDCPETVACAKLVSPTRNIPAGA